MQLSNEQLTAVTKIKEWLALPLTVRKPFLVTGEAGTGKSTIVSYLFNNTNLRTMVVTFTGKAASVLRAKGVTANTIHSTIYTPKIVKGKLTFKRRTKKDMKGWDLIIIDEISMVSKELLKDLLSLGVTILAFGDFRQLPPVGDTAALKETDNNYRLNEVHRQALESNILRYARSLVDGTVYVPNPNANDLAVISYDDLGRDVVLSHDVVICGTNNLREHYNREIRKILGFTGILQAGEKIIVLRNSPEAEVYNGEIFTVEAVQPYKNRKDIIDVTVKCPLSGKDIHLRLPLHLFTGEQVDETVQKTYNGAMSKGNLQMATYGYVITGHKSQGSTFERVMILDESYVFRGMEINWLYTAVTRGSKQVTIVREK